MEPELKKTYVEQATQQKDKYLRDKRDWLASRALGTCDSPDTKYPESPDQH
jgi:hypothetical protein